MSLLVVLIPARDRLGANPAPGSADYAYLTSADGLSVSSHGRCATSLLPRADSVVAVLADTDVAWQRLTLPRAPAARLRAALIGSLEERVLDDPEGLHYALAPGASPGQPTWVAIVHRAWLGSHLNALEAAGVPVARVVPIAWPDALPQGHFSTGSTEAAGAPLSLHWSNDDGAVTLRLQGGLSRALLAAPQGPPVRWTASPAAAAPAERWLESPVAVLSDEQRALQATRSLWNLRQFDLAPHHRGALALRDSWAVFLSPAWRPVRLGLATMALVQLLGLNLWAAHQRSEIAERRQAMVDLLRATHPQIRSVLDAPAQMRREAELLRAAAGRPGDSDLEVLLGAAAAAWPDGQPPLASLRFEPGRLSFSTAGWNPPQIDQFRARLRPAGWAVDTQGGALTLSRAASTAGNS
jgi:general secretion pathway protein L